MKQEILSTANRPTIEEVREQFQHWQKTRQKRNHSRGFMAGSHRVIQGLYCQRNIKDIGLKLYRFKEAY